MGEKYGCMGSFFHGRPVSVLERFQRHFSNTSVYRCSCNFSYNVYDVQTQNEKGGKDKGRITRHQANMIIDPVYPCAKSQTDNGFVPVLLRRIKNVPNIS